MPLLTQEQVEQKVFGSQRRFEQVMYWRKPLGDESSLMQAIRTESRWISVGDTQATKYMQKVMAGWQCLPQYGRVTKGSSDGVGAQWDHILSHPDGPGAFPASQIINYRWYRPERLPGSFMGKEIYWPQLADMTLQEYGCPFCPSADFLEPFGLANHMMKHHDWDSRRLDEYGQAHGINFNRTVVREFVMPPRPYVGPGGSDPEPLKSQYMVERIVIPDELPSAHVAPLPGVSPLYEPTESERPPEPQPAPEDVQEKWKQLQQFAEAMGLDLSDRAVEAERKQPARSAVKARRKMSPENAAKSRASLAKARAVRAEQRAAAVPALV